MGGRRIWILLLGDRKGGMGVGDDLEAVELVVVLARRGWWGGC